MGRRKKLKISDSERVPSKYEKPPPPAVDQSGKRMRDPNAPHSEVFWDRSTRTYCCRLPSDLLMRAGAKQIQDGIGGLNLVVQTLLELWVSGEIQCPIVMSRSRRRTTPSGETEMLPEPEYEREMNRRAGYEED